MFVLVSANTDVKIIFRINLIDPIMVCSFYSSAFTDTKPYTAMDYQEGLCWLSVDDGPTLYACEKSCETNWVLRALALKNFENGHMYSSFDCESRTKFFAKVERTH